MPDDHLGIQSAHISGKFGAAAFKTSAPIIAANTNAAIGTSTHASDEETDHFNLLVPNETSSWEQKVINKLEQGLEGEAYHILMKNLDGRSPEYTMKKLAQFHEEFLERGFPDLARDVGELLQTLSCDLNLNHSMPEVAGSAVIAQPRYKIPPPPAPAPSPMYMMR